jgi:hypothetical protein
LANLSSTLCFKCYDDSVYYIDNSYYSMNNILSSHFKGNNWMRNNFSWLHICFIEFKRWTKWYPLIKIKWVKLLFMHDYMTNLILKNLLKSFNPKNGVILSKTKNNIDYLHIIWHYLLMILNNLRYF